ncbi:T9SS type A sorting domain-containing protein [Flavobacterium pedocola]
MKIVKFLFCLAFIFPLKGNSQTITTVYQGNDPSIEIFMVSQGFTTTSMSNFDNFVTTFINDMFGDPSNPTTYPGTPPFNALRDKFKVTTVKVLATVEGEPFAYFQHSGTGSPSTAYFCGGATYNPAISDISVYNDFRTRMDNLTATLPNYNSNSLVIAYFNNNYYTGGGGKYVFTTRFCGSPIMRSVVKHELGHTFGVLGDEYDQTFGANVTPSSFPIFFDRNVTDKTTNNQAPWAYLINQNATCVNTPNCNVGMFLGANYTNSGWYRSEQTCLMRDLGTQQKFCHTCEDILRETILKYDCHATETITENFINKHQYMLHLRKSSNLLTTTSVIGPDISVKFTSQNTVLLSDGFLASTGSDFTATISDCSYIDITNNERISNQREYSPIFPLELINFSKIENEETNSIDGLNIYPNPANDLLHITTDANGVKTVVIYDVVGKQVLNTTTANESISVASLNPGIYMVKITEEGKTATRKLVIK